jgi:lipid-binding SYLF domain-containing protein
MQRTSQPVRPDHATSSTSTSTTRAAPALLLSPLLALLLALLLTVPMGALQAESVFDGLKQKASAALEKAGTVAGDAARKTGEVAGDAASAAGELGSKAVDHAKTTANEAVEDLGDADTPADTRARLDAMAQDSLARLVAEHEDARPLVEESAGYAVFDTRQVQWGVAGAYGRGVAVDKASGQRTYMRMGSAGVGIGFGIGGFDTQVVILFETPAALQTFITQGVDASAEAGTMLGDNKDQLTMGFVDGRAVFLLTKKGWKVSAKVAGARYWRDEKLNAPES